MGPKAIGAYIGPWADPERQPSRRFWGAPEKCALFLVLFGKIKTSALTQNSIKRGTQPILLVVLVDYY